MFDYSYTTPYNRGMKLCLRCKVEKEISEFHHDRSRKDGLMNRCIKCDRRFYRQKRQRNVDNYRARDKRYYERHKEEILRTRQEWRDRNWFKVKAHEAVRRALRMGVITRQPCFCGDTRTDAHHEDYTKPLEIQWLCRSHHNRIHV